MDIKGLIKTITEPFVRTYQNWRHEKVVTYSYNDLTVNILPGVFSPVIHYSTGFFLDYIKNLDLTNKTVLELGCGSGIISVISESKGGIVTASDVNEVAITELTARVRDENLNVIVVYSDLFENLHFHFDYIFINPPTLCKTPKSINDKSTMAGESFEYFDRLFAQLKVRTLRETEVLMILPEEAELFSVNRRAKSHHLKLKTQKVMSAGLNRAVVYRVVAHD
tara:strand:+ start:103551 stop:104219 length:669 start_codon:yes stop_codon:yes gene_type:complete